VIKGRERQKDGQIMSLARLRRMKKQRRQLAEEEEEEELGKAQVSMERVLVGRSSSSQKKKKID
jgi:hypothetical protein